MLVCRIALGRKIVKAYATPFEELWRLLAGTGLAWCLRAHWRRSDAPLGCLPTVAIVDVTGAMVDRQILACQLL